MVIIGLVLLSSTKELNDSEAKSLADEYTKFLLPICPVWAGCSSTEGLLGKYFNGNGIDVLDSLNILESRLKNLSHFLQKNK